MEISERKSHWKKILILVSIIPNATASVLNLIFNITPIFHANVFESLLQVIAILFGFSIIGIFHYLSKLDDYQVEYLSANQDARTHLVRLMQPPAGVELTDERKQIMEDIKKRVEKLDAKLESYNDRFVEAYSKARRLILDWGKWTVYSYGSGLAFSFVALLTPSLGLEDSQFPILIASLSSVVLALYQFIDRWYDQQDLADNLLKVIADSRKIV